MSISNGAKIWGCARSGISISSGNLDAWGVVIWSVRSLLVVCWVAGLATACSANGEGPSITSQPVETTSLGTSTSPAPTTAMTSNPGCDDLDREPPERLEDDLTAWLRETQSDQGEVPQDLEVTIIDAVGEDGTWMLVADFNSRFEAGVFAMDQHGDFRVVWGGIASTDTEIRESITSTARELPPLLRECVDISGFVEG